MRLHILSQCTVIVIVKLYYFYLHFKNHIWMTIFFFLFQLETGIETIQVIKEAYTYVNIIPSPLHVVLLDGSPTKVSRGIMFSRVFLLFIYNFHIQLAICLQVGDNL